MKKILLGLCFLVGVVFAAEKVAPELPETVKLTNGAVLKKISVIRWNSDGVVLKHQGGADPIRFVHIDASQRATFEALAKEAKKKPATGAPAASSKSVSYKGQAFITTRGAGSYKLGGMTVYVFTENVAAFFESNQVIDLPKPLVKTTTDADGNFSFRLSDETPFFIFAQTSRAVGKFSELYEWRILSSTITDNNRVLLMTENHRDSHARVRIAD